MDDEHGHGLDEDPANKPEDTSGTKQRDAVNRFAKYTAPTLLALLASDKVLFADTAG
jgi:hypothetical protein